MGERTICVRFISLARLTFATIMVNWFCFVSDMLVTLPLPNSGRGEKETVPRKQLSFRWMIAPQGSPATSATRSSAKGNTALKYKNP